MLKKAEAMLPKLIAWRRDLHAYPELGFQELQTAEKVAKVMANLGYKVKRGVGKTGVVADLGADSPRIAIRADMDALPIQELTEAVYASTNPGIMHACGHDVHMTCALGAAALLANEDPPGAIRFLFQPSEEVGDEEGLSGAQRMIADGALDGVDAVIALHVDPATSCGSIRTGSGPASGGVDSWFAEVIGIGGHGAYPYEALDPFFLTAQVINALNAIVSRRMYPFHPAVISIGSIHGGATENVIPERVKITGTLRYTEQVVREQIHREIRRAFEVAKTLGGAFELRFENGTPPMINEPHVTALIAAVGSKLLGEEHVLNWKQDLGAEDFGCFLELVPGAMFTLGTSGEGPEYGLHHPKFDVDEKCLPKGSAILAETAIQLIKHFGRIEGSPVQPMEENPS